MCFGQKHTVIYICSGSENIAVETPKRAPSVPSDLSILGQSPGLSKEIQKPGSMTRLPQRNSKETTPVGDKQSDVPNPKVISYYLWRF